MLESVDGIGAQFWRQSDPGFSFWAIPIPSNARAPIWRDYRAEWDDLASRALEPNVFLEASFALSFAGLDSGAATPLFLLVCEGALLSVRGRLIALRALVFPRTIFGRTVKAWVRDFCCSGAPLLDKEKGSEGLELMFGWLKRHTPQIIALSAPQLLGTGPTLYWLAVDGRMVAGDIVLLSVNAAYFWKTAYDEDFGFAPPGVLLTLEMTDRLLQEPRVLIADSCAVADHPMIDHIWKAFEDGGCNGVVVRGPHQGVQRLLAARTISSTASRTGQSSPRAFSVHVKGAKNNGFRGCATASRQMALVFATCQNAPSGGAIDRARVCSGQWQKNRAISKACRRRRHSDHRFRTTSQRAGNSRLRRASRSLFGRVETLSTDRRIRSLVVTCGMVERDGALYMGAVFTEIDRANSNF